MGWIANSENISVNQNEIKVTIQSIGENSGINTQLEKEIRLFCVISFSNPINNNLDRTIMLSFSSDKVQLSLTGNLNFQIKITNQISELMNQYQKRLMLFALVTFDADGNPVSYSKTFIG